MARQRMELGLTQEQLNEKTGVSRMYLNRVENGYAQPSPELTWHLKEILAGVEQTTPATG